MLFKILIDIVVIINIGLALFTKLINISVSCFDINLFLYNSFVTFAPNGNPHKYPQRIAIVQFLCILNILDIQDKLFDIYVKKDVLSITSVKKIKGNNDGKTFSKNIFKVDFTDK